MPALSSLISRDSPPEIRLQDRFRFHFDRGWRFKSRIEKRLLGDRDTDVGEDQRENKRRHVWAPRTGSDFASTTIQRHIRTGFYDHPTRGEARFRARYRVPKAVYVQLKAELLRLDPSLDETTSRARRRDNLVPVDNRILTTLRILGRGMTVQDDLDHSGMSTDAVRKTFKRIVRLISSMLFDKYVHLPQSDEELQRTMAMYDNIGLTGALGSMDATHVPWDRCPAALRHMHVGKDGHPTLTHNCVVANDLFFMGATRSKPGSLNDKTLVRFDSIADKLRTGMYKHIEFVLFDENGTPHVHKDPYLIVDGGYHMWVHLVCGYGRAANAKQAEYTARIASARKDVECAFGILKQRFRILKIPLQFRSAATIDAVFRTCMVLHNLILVADGRRFMGHSRRMDLAKEADEFGAHRSLCGSRIARGPRPTLTVTPGTDVTSVGLWETDIAEVDPDFETRRAALKDHFWYLKYTRNCQCNGDWEWGPAVWPGTNGRAVCSIKALGLGGRSNFGLAGEHGCRAAK